MDNLTLFLSEKRLSKYGNPEQSRTVGKYFFNVQLCESFYPTLSQFEISLRNKIDSVFSKYMGADWIFHQVAKDPGLADLLRITDRNKLIDSLSFGFWSRLFQDINTDTIWNKYPSMLAEIFPNRTVHLELTKVCFEINFVRRWRNRFSHNGTLLICSRHQMPCHKMHNLLYRLMREMGARPVLRELKKVDRFNEIFIQGKKLGFVDCGI